LASCGPLLGRQRDVVLDAPAQHHHAPRLAPAAQAQFVFDGLPALAGLGGARPVLAPEQPLDQPLDVGRLAQAQQVAQISLLAHVDDVFVAVAAVPAHQRWRLVAEFIEQPAIAALAWPEVCCLPEAEHRVEHQAQVAHPEGVQHVAGPARLVRVVADLGAFLAAVQRLDRGVQVQHPGPVQGIAHAGHQRAAHPRLAGLGHHRLQGAAHRVLADHAAQAQRLGRHRVASHAGDVRVAFAAGQDAQHQRAQHVARARGVGAAVVQRAACTQRSNTPAVARNSAKNTICPCGVAWAVSSQRTCTRPPIVSTTIASSLACASAVFFGSSASPIG
jgi:hypothetical protein